MTFNAIKNQPIGVNEKVDYLRESAKSAGFCRRNLCVCEGFAGT